MNTALKRAITDWERSGQGDGGYNYDNSHSDDDNNDEDNDNANDDNNNDENLQFGDLRGRTQRALDLRCNFLSINHPISFIFGTFYMSMI